MTRVSLSKIVGAASPDRWSQVHTFEPSHEKLSSHGTLLLVVLLQALESPEDNDIDMPSFGREVIQRFHEQYYGVEARDVSVLTHLVDTVKVVSHEFEQVVVHLVAGVFLPTETPGRLGVCYFAGVGSGSCVVLRDDRLYRVLAVDGREESRKSGKVVVASGFVKSGDVLLLGSGEFFRLVSPELLRKSLLLRDPDEISSVLAPQVHGTQESSGVAAVIASFGKALRDEATLVSGPEERERAEASESATAPELDGGKTRFFWTRLAGFWERARKGVAHLRRRPTGSPALEEGEIIVRGEERRHRRLMFSVAFSLLVLLGLSIFFGWRRRVEEGREQAFGAIWEVADHQYNEALTLIELNPLRSRALLSQAKQQIEEGLSDTAAAFSKAHRERLSDRLEEISLMLEQVSGEHRIEEADVFLDLSLVRSNTYAEALGLHEDTLVVLDRASGVLLRMSVANKSADSVGGGPLLSEAQLASVYAGRGFVISDSGVVEVSLSRKTSAVVVEPDPEWGGIVDLEVFGGNLYLLDRDNGEIFQYQGTEGGFGPRRRWFGEGIVPDLSGAVAMAIDGDIWVLTNDDILHFRRGVPEVFSITGLDVPFVEPVALYTDDDSERLYVLDRGNRRVVVLDKSGEYRKQYLWDGIRSVSDMVVSETEGKILLLSGSDIYEIGFRE